MIGLSVMVIFKTYDFDLDMKHEKKWRCVRCMTFETDDNMLMMDHQVSIHGLIV